MKMLEKFKRVCDTTKFERLLENFAEILLMINFSTIKTQNFYFYWHGVRISFVQYKLLSKSNYWKNALLWITLYQEGMYIPRKSNLGEKSLGEVLPMRIFPLWIFYFFFFYLHATVSEGNRWNQILTAVSTCVIHPMSF